MDETGERPLHRNKDGKREERRTEKEKKERTWYKRRTRNKPTNVFPIFCPATPRGILACTGKNLREEVNKQSQGLVVPKIIEQGDALLKDFLCKNSPKKEDNCEKRNCPVCWSGKDKGKNCLKTTGGGAGYMIKCETCGRHNMKSVYHGETSRTLYSTLTEHARALEKEQEDNPLTKHK